MSNKTEKTEKKVSDDMMESIKATLEEFEKHTSSCHCESEDMVELLYKAYEEGFYGSFEAKEETVLRLLKEFVDARLKEVSKKK